MIPSFAATKSLLSIDCKPVTRIVFTPIIPYPTAVFDTVYTAMASFLDVFSQKTMKYSGEMKVYTG